jgi:hypothetical protein
MASSDPASVFFSDIKQLAALTCQSDPVPFSWQVEIFWQELPVTSCGTVFTEVPTAFVCGAVQPCEPVARNKTLVSED